MVKSLERTTSQFINLMYSTMDRWQNKTAVVTGAGAGMGAAIATTLSEAGMKVIGLEVNPEGIESLNKKGIISRRCDISKPEELAAVFEWIESEHGGVHVLVNNAGVLFQGQITDVGNNTLPEEKIISTLDINLKAGVLCTRHAVSSMKKNEVDGHIIHINSLAGHYVPFSTSMNVYAGTKHAITAFTGALFNEMAHFNSRIKVTSISPGMTKTNMAKHIGPETPFLKPSDIADAVLYVVSTPPHVNISELTIQPVMDKRM